MIGLLTQTNDKEIREISEKIVSGDRISPEEGLILYKKADLPLLGVLAGITRRRING
jgi:aminodeoxyfutalosine synthase